LSLPMDRLYNYSIVVKMQRFIKINPFYRRMANKFTAAYQKSREGLDNLAQKYVAPIGTAGLIFLQSVLPGCAANEPGKYVKIGETAVDGQTWVFYKNRQSDGHHNEKMEIFSSDGTNRKGSLVGIIEATDVRSIFDTVSQASFDPNEIKFMSVDGKGDTTRYEYASGPFNDWYYVTLKDGQKYGGNSDVGLSSQDDVDNEYIKIAKKVIEKMKERYADAKKTIMAGIGSEHQTE